MPPSPRLSACRTKVTYLIETTIVIVQKTSDMTPWTLDWSTVIPSVAKTA